MKKLKEEYLAWKSIYAPTASVRYRPVLAKIKKLESYVDVKNLKDDWSRELKPATVAFHIAVLKNFVAYLKENGHTKLSANLIKIPRFTPSERDVATKEEVEKMLAVWDESNFLELRNKTIISFIWSSGVRLSELTSLDLKDIEEQFARIQTKKSFRIDFIKWDRRTHLLLQKYLGVRLAMAHGEHVFISNAPGNPRITNRQVEKIFATTCKRAGIRSLSPHALRHGFAHDKLNKGANVKDLQSMLRHSDRNPQAAFQYIKLSRVEQRNILNKYI